MFSCVRSVSACALGAPHAALPTRSFKKVRVDREAIQKARELKANQKKTYLDSFYAKYGQDPALQKDRENLDEREKVTNEINRAKRKKASEKGRLNMRNDPPKQFLNRISAFRDDVAEFNAHANDPIVAERARRKAYQLHVADPRALPVSSPSFALVSLHP